jgi:hypothetical protein
MEEEPLVNRLACSLDVIGDAHLEHRGDAR